MSSAIITKHFYRVVLDLVILAVEDLADSRNRNLDELLLGEEVGYGGAVFEESGTGGGFGGEGLEMEEVLGAGFFGGLCGEGVCFGTGDDFPLTEVYAFSSD